MFNHIVVKIRRQQQFNESIRKCGAKHFWWTEQKYSVQLNSPAILSIIDSIFASFLIATFLLCRYHLWVRLFKIIRNFMCYYYLFIYCHPMKSCAQVSIWINHILCWRRKKYARSRIFVRQKWRAKKKHLQKAPCKTMNM